MSREEHECEKQSRFASTVVISAAIIAAVRLARDDTSKPAPRLRSDKQRIVEHFRISKSVFDLPPSYNVAPTSDF